MAGLIQTNVRVLPVVADALDNIAGERELSREQAARDLLHAHLVAQEKVAPEMRASHISTILRFPPRPHRPSRDSDGLVRVSLRLAPGVKDRTVATALVLPGQTVGRSHRDYVAAPLTDALVTAVARARPVAVEGLEGLPQAMPHAAAIGLWRLTIAATLTRPELRALWGGDDRVGGGGADRPELKRHLRGGDVAWHHPWRCEVALSLARHLLIGPQRPLNMRMLREQGEEFEFHQSELERSEDLDHEFFSDFEYSEEFALTRQGRVSGRGGSAVWRARRKLAMNDIAKWLHDADRPEKLIVDPPQWALTMPKNWVTATGSPKSEKAQDAAAGRVLAVSYEGNQVMWPYDRTTNKPIAGFDALITGMPKTLTPEQIVELVLLDDEHGGPLYLMAPVACDLGLITESERDARVAKVHADSLGRMAAELKRAHEYCTPGELAKLKALTDPYEFERAVRKHRSRRNFYVRRPTWPWLAGTLVDVVQTHRTHPARIAAATAVFHKYRRRDLETEMERETRRTVGYGSTSPDDFDDAWDGDLKTLIGLL